MQAASTAHSLCCCTCRVFVCPHPEKLYLRGLKGNLVTPFNCFLPETSTRFFSLGSSYWFLHNVTFVLLLKPKVVSKLHKYHSQHSFYLKPGVLHGNWPKSDLSCCLLTQPQGNTVIFSDEFVLHVGFWVVGKGDVWAFWLWASWGPHV